MYIYIAYLLDLHSKYCPEETNITTVLCNVFAEFGA